MHTTCGLQQSILAHDKKIAVLQYSITKTNITVLQYMISKQQRIACRSEILAHSTVITKVQTFSIWYVYGCGFCKLLGIC